MPPTRILAILGLALILLPAAQRTRAAASPHTLVGAVDFVNGSVGWAVVSSSEAYTVKKCIVRPAGVPGCNQAITRIDATTDGGATWRAILQLRGPIPLQGETGLPSVAVHMVTERAGFIGAVDVHGHTILLSTADGGAHWTRYALPGLHPVGLPSNDTLSFPDQADGYYLIHTNGAMQHESVDVWATHDGGAHWTRVEYGSFTGSGTPHAIGLPGDKGPMFFLNRNSAWVTAEDAGGVPYLYATEDQGRTWARQTPPMPRSVTRPGKGIQGYYGSLGAATFFTQTSGLLPEHVVTCLGLPSNCKTTLFVQHLVDNGRRWSNPTLLRKATTMAPLSQLLGPNRWFVGDGARLWTTANAGRTWRAMSSLPGGLVPAEISFVAANRGWVIGRSPHDNAAGYPNVAALFATSDGGRHWSRVALP